MAKDLGRRLTAGLSGFRVQGISCQGLGLGFRA